MNVVVKGVASSSECSSGCESGWTLYLEHSCSSSFGRNKNKKVKEMKGFYEKQDYYNDDNNNNNNVEEFEEEEDLSMMSDASSGPPHFDHDIDEDDDDEVEEVLCYGSKKRSKRISNHFQCDVYESQDFTLDDTASSSMFTTKKCNNGDNKGSSFKSMIDYSSQGFSTNHFHQGRSSNFQGHYGLLQPHLYAKQFRQNQW